MSSSKVVALIGVGARVGEHIAQSFASKSYSVALLSRSVDSLQLLAARLGHGSHAFFCDVTDPATIKKAFSDVRQHYSIEEPDIVVYNVTDGHFGDFNSIDANAFTDCWKRSALGVFHVAKEITPGMVHRGHGVLGITGATASWRGMPGTVAFAPAKAAQRSLAQSLARDLGPKGIHVYLLVVDGRIADGGGSNIAPSAVGDTHVFLSEQPNTAWTFELNITAGPGYDKLATI